MQDELAYSAVGFGFGFGFGFGTPIESAFWPSLALSPKPVAYRERNTIGNR